MDNSDCQLKDAAMEFPMSPEEIERTIRFLLQQQAQFDSRLERLVGKTDLIADGVIGLTGIVGRLAEETRESRVQLQEQLRESRQRQEEADAELRAYIHTVEAHLNVVIEMFERHMRHDHGQQPS
jgi:hypothetical protein